MTLLEEVRQTEKELTAEGAAPRLDPIIVAAIIVARSINASAVRISKSINSGLFDITSSIDVQGGK